MEKYIYYFLFIVLISCTAKEDSTEDINKIADFAIVIHGGAGNISQENISDEEWESYKSSLSEALNIGYSILEQGGSSLDAVEATIMNLENNPLFNAGKGAVYNSMGQQEMDASIMTGNDLNAGAVAGVNQIKNPIKAARLVMEKSKHVMLSGNGAIIYAKENGLEIVDSTYFFVKKRYDSWKRMVDKEKSEKKLGQIEIETGSYWEDSKYGTVGAVAIDKEGNIVAGTSTGGMTNKKYGRIGDSPIIGAGTYANNNTCGVSSTGTGEYFIRTLAAHEISSLVKYEGMTIEEASHEVIYNQIGELGGDGGVIVLDKYGNVHWEFNTAGMFRAYKNSNGDMEVKAFKD